jgi:signal transduction histidine kinase
LALPLLALVVVSGVEVKRANDRADEAAQEAELALATAGPASLISSLQNERNITGLEELGISSFLDLPVENSQEARAATDAAIAELNEFVAARGEAVAAQFAAGQAAVSADLTSLRNDVDASTIEKGLSNQTFADQVFVRYNAIIGVLIDDTAGFALDIDDNVLRNGAELVSLSTLVYEIGSNTVRDVLLANLTNNYTIDLRLQVAQQRAVRDRLVDEIFTRSVGPYEGIPEEWALDPRIEEQNAIIDLYPRDANADIIRLVATVQSGENTGFQALRTDATAVLQREADRIVDAANDEQSRVILLAGAALLAAVIITILASRSITSPLRSLTRQARDMATATLPSAVQQVLDTPLGDDVEVPNVAPISVKTRDEVADVAVALNTVQGSALDLAVEQAVLRRNIADSFVNLGRRNQNLLDRQLDFITDLEREEQEPERLEGLFRLDHLATRMRRNAESLLRLAGGGDDAMSATLSEPIPMVDVVRGALGEVEDYQRVDVRSLDAATVTASAGADLAHALAELIENSLTFSPPHERVEIRGRREGDGYTLAVIDQGVGMSEEQLAVANRRLAGKESFTVAPSRYLGHYVAGHLAQSHGISIQLKSAAAGGVTARVDLPARLLVDDGATGTVSLFPAAAPETPPAPAPEPEPQPTADHPAPAAPAVEPEVAAEPAFSDGGSLPRRVHEPAAAPDAPAPVAEEAPPLATATSGGLTRRVRGANAPTATNVAAAFGGADPTPAAPAPTTADDVASFLSAFSGGVERGLAETTHPDEEEQ